MPKIPRSQAGALSGLLDVVNPVAGIVPISGTDLPLVALLERFASRLPRQTRNALSSMSAIRLPKAAAINSSFSYHPPRQAVSIAAPTELPFVAGHELGHATQLLTPDLGKLETRLGNLVYEVPQRLRELLYEAFGSPGLRRSEGIPEELIADALGSVFSGQQRGSLFQQFRKLGFPDSEILRAQFTQRMATSPAGKRFVEHTRRKAGILRGE